MNANTLLLRLEGPMQSYGASSKWSHRDTLPFPTKSAVVGLLVCALGLGPRDDETIQRLSESIRVGVRSNRPLVVQQDYQTIGAGYPAHLTAAGKIKKQMNGDYHVEQSWKHYLADASFLVAVQSEYPDLIDSLARAVQSPVWPYFLGRRSYIPTAPVFMAIGKYGTLVDALRHGWPAGEAESLQAQIECDANHPNRIRLNDQTVSFNRRQFAPRYVYDIKIQPGGGNP